MHQSFCDKELGLLCWKNQEESGLRRSGNVLAPTMLLARIIISTGPQILESKTLMKLRDKLINELSVVPCNQNVINVYNEVDGSPVIVVDKQ